MAIPSGSGTEVLKRFIQASQSNTQVKAIDGVANHIYTVISITVYNRVGTDYNLYFKIAPDAGTHIIMSMQTIPSYKVFVWNDRFVLSGTDELVLEGDSGSNFDIIVSYIDQDWT